jgi:hypothetical protein
MLEQRDPEPTGQLYGDIRASFVFLNGELFDGRLPVPIFTLQRRKNTLGYFARRRFQNAAGDVVDEIALNPAYFKRCSFLEVTSTLVHEMVHAWQFHFGRPSRSGYHNKEWAGEMLRLGLHPSSTGRPGGHMTGQAVSHYIIPGGRFDVTANRLLQTLPSISWFDTKALELLPQGLEDFFVPERSSSGRRLKFVCTGDCGAAAWGKASLQLRCQVCDRDLVPAFLHQAYRSRHA